MELITNLSIVCFAALIFMACTAIPLPEPDRLTGRERTYIGVFLFIYSFAIIFAASFRYGFVDTTMYKAMYKAIGTDVDNAFNDTIPVDDYGFNLLMVFLNRINPDPQLLIIVTSVFSFGAFLYTMNKYSSDLPFTLALFFCTSVFTSMNGIRQVVASGFMLLALPLLMKRKALWYLLIIWVCTTLHASAYVMMPLYFVLSGKRLNKGVWLVTGLTVLCFLFPGPATSVMGEILEDSTYKEYLQVDSQMSMIRFVVELVPILVTLLYCVTRRNVDSYVGPDHPDYQNQRLLDVLINMQIVSFCFTALGLRMVFFARISIYFPCVLPLLLPVTLRGCFNKESGKFVKMIAVVMYLLFFVYQTYTYDQHSYLWAFYLNF